MESLRAADADRHDIAERLKTALDEGRLSLGVLVVWALVTATVDGAVHPWPVWLLVPGAALAVTTVGVQTIRRRR
ncbi:DUF1707 domain-containing protein [Couchioplanes azureus]|uniref:DUF1707 domain-containing protein n=1 Tax=Couchioplanes caeruleus TaxID=56438 RepID=UPI0019A8499A|nr:DUF1707 domain-containing protein [Couchioplanes caeruleus]GGQ67217.1 hypothetical protein GCM10010166_41340 [Couchioplanes caeruleus subsp. azureus]